MSSGSKQLDLLWRAVDRFQYLLPSGEEEEPGIQEPANREIENRMEDFREENYPEEVEEQASERYLYDRIFFGISRRFRRYSEERNIFKVRAVLEEMDVHLPFISQSNASLVQERVASILEEIQNIEPVLIFSDFGEDEATERNIYPVTSSTLIEIPKLIIEVKNELASRVAMEPESLRRISPRAFEELIAEIFSGFGYIVELTAPSRDGGKDIVAIRTDHGIVSKLLIECKRYVPPNKVDVGLVRQLYTVKQLEHASKALLVTTSYFTRPAREMERQHLYELELKDFDAVTGWVKEHSLVMGGGLERPHNTTHRTITAQARRRR